MAKHKKQTEKSTSQTSSEDKATQIRNQTNRDKLSSHEISFILSLAFSLSLRQLGILMVIPFISLFASTLEGGTPALAGLSLGIYGLMQAVLQVPFGYASDRLGRKKVLLLGQMVFAAGFFLAVFSQTIWSFIIARILQGMGAVSSVIYAWVGDRIEESRRNRGMAILGAAMGLSAVVSFILGPFLYSFIGMKGTMLLTAILTVVSTFLILIFIKSEDEVLKKPESSGGKNNERGISYFFTGGLTFSYLAGFIANFLMVSFFFILPLVGSKIVGEEGLWQIYVPGAVLGMLLLRPIARLADSGRLRLVIAVSLAFASSSLIFILALSSNALWLQISAFLLFAGYMGLTTLLPTMVSRLVESEVRGTATGFYNTAQFIGSFAGGALTGIIWENTRMLAYVVPSLLGIVTFFAAILLPVFGAERNETSPS